MDKGKIRVALAALSVAGLVAGLTLTGCKSSCGASSCSGTKMEQPSGGSCTGSGAKPEAPKMMPKE